jgi:hypothetical protein
MLPAVYRIRKDILKIGTDLQTKKIQFVGRACKTAAVFVLQLWILNGFAIHSVNLFFFCCFTNYQVFFVNKRCFLRYWVIGLGYWGLKVGLGWVIGYWVF